MTDARQPPSRLDDIVRRNRDAQRWTPLSYFKLAIVLFIVGIAIIAMVTKASQPPADSPADPPAAPRVNGVLLR